MGQLVQPVLEVSDSASEVRVARYKFPLVVFESPHLLFQFEVLLLQSPVEVLESSYLLVLFHQLLQLLVEVGLEGGRKVCVCVCVTILSITIFSWVAYQRFFHSVDPCLGH